MANTVRIGSGLGFCGDAREPVTPIERRRVEPEVRIEIIDTIPS